MSRTITRRRHSTRWTLNISSLQCGGLTLDNLTKYYAGASPNIPAKSVSIAVNANVCCSPKANVKECLKPTKEGRSAGLSDYSHSAPRGAPYELSLTKSYCSRASSIFSRFLRAHDPRAFTGSRSELPISVRLYSTLGGIV